MKPSQRSPYVEAQHMIPTPQQERLYMIHYPEDTLKNYQFPKADYSSPYPVLPNQPLAETALMFGNVTNTEKPREGKRLDEDSRRQESLQVNLPGNAIQMKKRRQGAPPKDSASLITADYTEGIYAEVTRAVFRCFNEQLLEMRKREIRRIIRSGGH